MKISLTTKIFLLVLFAILILVTCVGTAGSILFEKFFFMQKESDYLKLADSFSQEYSGNVQDNLDLIGMVEDKYGLNVTITDQIGIIQYTTVIKGNPWGGTAERWKNDNVFIPEYVRDGLSNGDTLVYYTQNDKYGTKILIIASPLNNDQILLLELLLQPVKESIIFMLKFYLFCGMGAMLLGLAISYLISLKAAAPIKKISLIAKRMAESDFSVKYNDVHNDELDELGEALNIMSEKLETAERQNGQYMAKLQECLEKEKRTEKKRQEFVSNISQILNTPVSFINSHVKALVDDISLKKGDAGYYCKAIDDESSKIMELITDLLEVSILDRDDAILNTVNFDIVSLIENVSRRFEKEFIDKEIKYVICKDCDNITVKGDPYRIEQVFVNILTNAIKHAEGEKGIVVKIVKSEKRTIVKVFNTGKNIPYEELDKIWESFYRTVRTQADKKGSTGLGLYIVKKVLKLHRSGFGVKNLKGGVEFWFDIECF